MLLNMDNLLLIQRYCPGCIAYNRITTSTHILYIIYIFIYVQSVILFDMNLLSKKNHLAELIF